MKFIDGKATAAKIKENIKQEVETLVVETKIRPKLACVIVGDNPASQTYVRNKEKACEACGIESVIIRLDETCSESHLINVVKVLNNDTTIDGFIVQLPLPKHINEQKIINTIDPEKDVDGFTPVNLGRVMLGEDCYVPATPLGITNLLKEYEIETEGKNVLIIGRSNIVGKPMANILMNKPYNANVTVMHSKSGQQKLNDAIENADIIIAAVGVPEFLKTCRCGAILIDVGINRVDGKLVGDIDIEEVKHDCGGYTPVPGGVGPMTVCSLMENTLKAYKKKYFN